MSKKHTKKQNTTSSSSISLFEKKNMLIGNVSVESYRSTTTGNFPSFLFLPHVAYLFDINSNKNMKITF